MPLTETPSVLGTRTCTTTHVVVPGDTLSDIAAALLGNAAKWTSIYDANQSLIESVARQHPRRPVFGTSDHGHWIFPGTTLTIPGATCTQGTAPGTGTQSQLDQKSLTVQLLMATGMSQADAEFTVNGFGGCLTGLAFGKILDGKIKLKNAKGEPIELKLDTGTKTTLKGGRFALEVVTGKKPGTETEIVTQLAVPTIAGIVASKVASWVGFASCILFEVAPKAG
ncbi:LysM peptidoglycan-binding domain-containing protein [Streptomyces mirabilis]|uniref:LysM peptidoglycan-binding domain-containing protein n=1 Tax=Streptomyces mirabilis TaxID=68239 RepID=UPI00363399B4